MKKQLLLLTLLLAPPVWTVEARAEPTPEEQLEQVQAELAAREGKALELDGSAARAAREMKDLRRQLVEATAESNWVETLLEQSQVRLSELNAEIGARKAELFAKRQDLAKMLALMQRFSRTPAALTVLQSGDPVKIALARHQLKAMVPDLNERLAEIATAVEQLRTLEAAAAAEQTALNERQVRVAADQVKFDQLVKKRQARLKETQRLSAAERGEIARLAAEVADLAGLVAQLREQRQQPAGAAAREPLLLEGTMAAHLPASGYAFARFGEPDRAGTPSRGLSIRTRSAARVVAVAPGMVAFAGPFRGYGNMLIVEHARGWHTITGGLDTITADVGQRVARGEPVGQMGDGAGRRELYFEVRNGGKPVDPLGPLATRLTKGQN